MNNDIDKPQNKAASTAVLNKLRASVLGVNDGIVSTASVVMGVAGATDSTGAIFTAGLAALVAGALSMAVGEYVSVSSQSDAEKAYIEREKALLKTHPKEQLQELIRVYEEKGLSKATAKKVATELTAHDPLKAHLDVDMGDEDDIANPMQAATASLAAFTVGGIVPFIAIIMAPAEMRLWVTTIAVTIVLVATGYFSADVGGASRRRAIARIVLGGLAAMALTYVVGRFFGTAVL